MSFDRVKTKSSQVKGAWAAEPTFHVSPKSTYSLYSVQPLCVAFDRENKVYMRVLSRIGAAWTNLKCTYVPRSQDERWMDHSAIRGGGDRSKMEVLDRWLEDGSLTGLAGEGRFMSGGRPRVPLRGDVDDAYC